MKSSVAIFVALTCFVGSVASAQTKPGLLAGMAVRKKSAAPVSEKKPTVMEEVEERVKALQESVKAAAMRFDAAVNSTHKQRMASLDVVLATITTVVEECGPNGAMYKNLSKAIKVSEEKQKYYKQKASDQNISGKTREKYTKLAVRFEKSMKKLYDRRILLDKTRDELEEKAKMLAEDKEFIVDLIQANEIEVANEELAKVVDNIKSVIEAVDVFAEKVVEEAGATDVEEQ